MDTVRSEYSEGSLASSRLDDGSTTGRGSLSFSFSTSRVSIDSVSTRSDFLSSYERKFQQRKAAKHKKSEKAKREKEKADRQDLFSADLRRKAQREAERQARRKEMETWLTDTKELKRIERRSHKTSRDRMRTLKEWYAPATSVSGAYEEVQPVFVAAMHQTNQQEHSSRRKLVKPKTLLTKKAAAAKDEEDRDALGVVLRGQLNAFTSKLEYLEQLADPGTPSVRAKTRARRRRLVNKNLHLAPLGPARSNLRAAKSVTNLPTYFTSQIERKLATSSSMQMLQADNEDDEDAVDDAEVERYLLRHRNISRQNYAAVKLQAAWKMHLRRRKYLPWRQRRTRHRRAIFEIWVMTYRVGYRAQRSLLRKYFTAWRLDVMEALQLREMELHLFRQAATQSELPRMVLNLVFTSDWEDERAKRLAAEAAKKKKSLVTTSKAAFLNAFLSAAFGDVESGPETRSRVQQLHAQHETAREEVRKKIVQHVFRLWKRVHEGNKRVGLNAQLCLKRAVRMAFGTRQRWPAEILLSVFELWARWASFNRCKRLGLPLPQFPQTNPHWDVWLHNHQERQVRCVKAAAKAPAARLRRYFLRLDAFARRIIRKRQARALAVDHHSRVVRLKVLLEWRAAIADSAAEKKLERGILLRLHRYACAKRKLRPLKDSLRRKRRKWLARRSIRGWKRVQLHASFKRELTLSKIQQSQVWRSRLHRTLDVWRQERDSLLLWRTFEAWTHLVRKRKLFLTLRSLCARQERRTLLFGVLNAWKAAKWERVDGFLEDNLCLDAWDVYRELSAFFPMMFYGSFSDAGSIFGGLPSSMHCENGASQRVDRNELVLATSGDAVRHFHGVLVRESVMDVRNAILQTRHLVNAVDDASGNTALHVAAQIDETERRLEIVSLLLSEGATTLKRVNRHGLSPVQLAPDAATRFLLDHGIYAFYSRNVLHETEDCGTNHRLLWCMTSLMAREWRAGLRNPADVRTGHWHSTIRDELWLRQAHIRFACDSVFAAGVTRSHGFLNALKTRLCRSYKDILHVDVGLSRTQDESTEAGDRAWEERVAMRNLQAAETGEYEAYARYLLATNLDADACEQELIPSFAGLLFSLEFSVEEILSQAYRLEDECASAESELWELYQRIMRSEKAWREVYAQEDTTSGSHVSRYIGVLQVFSDDADADFFFKNEVFHLEFGQFNLSADKRHPDGLNGQREALALELESLLIRSKRKLRKVEKKSKRLQDQLDENERAHREVLFAAVRCLQDICAARKDLEHSRLRMASNVIKLSEAKAAVSRLELAKEELQSEEKSTPQKVSRAVDLLPRSVSELPYEEKKIFLDRERANCVNMFQTKVILEEAAAKLDSGNLEVKPLPESLHPLQREASSKLHSLFVLNLLRSCCCWLAENMVAMETNSQEENEAESGDSDSDGDSFQAEPEERRKLTRVFSTAGSLLLEGPPRRRSSIGNTRRLLETYQQVSSRSLEDPESDDMTATYAASASLLFEEERRAAAAAERERSSAKKVEIIAALSEQNPITGEPELPPDHTVSIDAVSVRTRPEAGLVDKKTEARRNRKKEELQRAMRHRQLLREAESDSDREEISFSSQDQLLPAIHGADFCFGNFVVGGGVRLQHEVSAAEIADLLETREGIGAVATDAIWKRGGAKQADISAPSIKEVLAQAHRQSSARGKLRPGSLRQVETAQESAQPLGDVPEAQPSLDLGVKVSGHSSPEQEDGDVAMCPLDQTGPTSHRQPDTESSSNLLNLLENSSSETQVLDSQQDESKEPEQFALPMQINTKSVRTGRVSSEEETRSSATIRFESVDEKENASEYFEDTRKITSTLETPDDDPPASRPNHEEIEEVDLRLHSPVVEISTSRTSDSRRKGSALSRTRDTEPNRSLDSDTHANAFVKWEGGAELDAFSLAVGPRLQSTSTADRLYPVEQEQVSALPRVHSLPATQTLVWAEEMKATRFEMNGSIPSELKTNVEVRNETFTLQGKSMKMTKKQKGIRLQTSGSGVFDATEKTTLPRRSVDVLSSDNALLERPPTAISVTVVTKRSNREEFVSESTENASDTSPTALPLPEKTHFSPPKPFIKLDGIADTNKDADSSASLLLEGLRLSGADKSVNASVLLTKLTSGSPTRLVETTRSSSFLAIHRKRGRDLGALEHRGLALQGARMVVPSEMKSGENSKKLTGLEDMTPLSKAERERLWQEFVAEPRSDNVRDAYSILYPQMYVPDAMRADALPVNRKKLYQPTALPVEPSNLSLRVDAIRDPLQTALEQNRKFWSAVEGFRAIGTSPLLSLDTATITQRRQDKAQAIFDQFCCGHREKGTMCSKRETRGVPLPWLEMYPNEVAEVQRQLESAPKGIFDELQQITELQISAALAKRQTDQALH
ncbi:hypothetical protein PInf_025184 [Phytophthora infestans]|nr:hypothetical protein PInf_025184 [Phytophthora infestans]